MKKNVIYGLFGLVCLIFFGPHTYAFDLPEPYLSFTNSNTDKIVL